MWRPGGFPGCGRRTACSRGGRGRSRSPGVPPSRRRGATSPNWTLNPPEGEVVVSVDAKTGIQALDRTQPALPMTSGRTAKRTHDYIRNGTLDMYAAIDVRTGRVTASLSKTHATPDFLRLMKKVVAGYDSETKIHVDLDKPSVHLSEDANKWLARQKGRVVFHFTPTGASWTNQIEIWNGIITRKVIRRGTYDSVKMLARAIEEIGR